MAGKAIKMFTVHYEGGKTETFSGKAGYVNSYQTKHKNSEGTRWESVTVHEASVSTHHGDWKVPQGG